MQILFRPFFRNLLVVAALMVLAVGCVKYEVDIVVNSDSSGSLEVSMDFSQELIEFIEAVEEVPIEEACRNLLQSEGVGDGTQLDGPLDDPFFSNDDFQTAQEIVVDDSNCGFIARGKWPAEQAEAVYLSLADESDIIIQRSGLLGWSFELPIDLNEGLDTDESANIGLVLAQLGNAALNLQVTLPGQTVDHNATSTTSSCGTTTFSWNISITDQAEFLFAETDGESDCRSSSNVGEIVAWVMLGGIGTAIATALVLRRLQRKRVPLSSA